MKSHRPGQLAGPATDASIVTRQDCCGDANQETKKVDRPWPAAKAM